MTAVEWLYKNLLENPISNEDVEYNEAVFHNAKEMEKQQIFESWDNGFDNGNYYGKYNENCETNCGEQYYNETFNKICEHCYITSADWKSQTCSKCNHRINL